jgi:hypothetical protein
MPTKIAITPVGGSYHIGLSSLIRRGKGAIPQLIEWDILTAMGRRRVGMSTDENILEEVKGLDEPGYTEASIKRAMRGLLERGFIKSLGEGPPEPAFGPSRLDV